VTRYHVPPGGTREGRPLDEMAFGRYRLLSVIGQGGMGTVYKAYDTVIGREVAIKVLPPELSTEPGYRDRFRREAHTAARLTEPHIIPIHDTGEIDGQLYLVMPIIDGTDAHGLLQRDGPMSPQHAVRFVEQLASALDAAHSVGLVHRDVKPGNALVTGNGFVYLIDFGIAHDAAASTKLTSTGMVVGTFAYMAPERFEGVADPRSDIYALACVLHECLVGDSPYPGDSMEQQIVGHLTLDPPQPSQRRPDVPVAFDEVVARGMAKDPNDRYQTAGALATAAYEALAGTPAATSRANPTRISDPVPSPPQSAGQGSAPANFAATRQHTPPDVAPAPPSGQADYAAPTALAPTPPARRRTGLIAALVVAAVLILVGGVTAVVVFLRQPQPQPAPTQFAQPPPPPSPTSSAPQAVAPAASTALDGLLLSPDQISTVMGIPGMAVVGTLSNFPDTSSFVSDAACVPLAYTAQAKVYANSGASAMREQIVAGNPQAFAMAQAVASFPSPQQASAFFAASVKGWQACSNRQFTRSANGMSQVHTVGSVANADGTLSVVITPANSVASCSRALTVANNVAVDISECGGPPGAAADAVHQIAAKVPKAQ
jgi:serine/threonine kinase PknH